MRRSTMRKPSDYFCVVFVCFLSFVLEGCLSLGQSSTHLEKDGLSYGVTEGAFRGRWWNYYERGCSYLDGGFYVEAVADLQIALCSRSQDQLWPRTYGLHFIPQYYPNRELGVAYFYQNRLEDSLRQLELSYGQHASARAAYYMNSVRKKLLENSGKDASSPTLTITAPIQGVAVSATEVEIQGVARDDTFVAAILINGHAVDVAVSNPEVSFSQTVPLAPGQNSVEVCVQDLLGKATVIHVPISSDVDGPLISFDAPLITPGPIRGIASDTSEVACVEIAGKPCVLSAGPDGAVLFSVDLAREELAPPLRYSSADRLGNITSGILPLDMLVLSDHMPDYIFMGGSGPFVSLGYGLEALIVNGHVMAVANTTPPPAGLTLSMSNLEEGRQYYMDEIVVALNIRSQDPIENVSLNGEPIPHIPGRNSLNICRKVRLTEGSNPLTADARDAKGATGSDRKTVERRPNAIEMNKGKLAIAMLGNVIREANPQSNADTEYILNELSSSKPVQKRFTVVDRGLLKEILSEQNLSEALGSKSGKLALGKLIPAEMMLTARIRRDQDTIEIALEGTSTETATRILPQVDVAGPYTDLDRLIEDLGVRLVQELPRVQGQVLQWSSPEITLDLQAAQGIRDSLKCIIFRTEDVIHPQTGETLGQKPVIVCEGLINNVSERFSTAEALASEGNADVSALAIEPGQYVVIK